MWRLLQIATVQGFIKDFASFTIKTFILSMFFDRGTSVSIQICNFRIFVYEIFRDSRGIAPNVFADILISVPPENIIYLVSTWIQGRSVFNGTKTIAILGPKMWDLLLDLVIDQKNYINIFLEKYNDLEV